MIVRYPILTAFVTAMILGSTVSGATRGGQVAVTGGSKSNNLDATLRTLVNAASRGDCVSIASLVNFPVDYWSAATRHGTEDVGISDAAELIAHCDRYIDATTRSRVRHATRKNLKDGRVVLSWDDENSSSVFELAPTADGTYRLVHFVRGAR